MAQVGFRGSAGLYAIDGDNPPNSGLFDLQTPAGWQQVFWWGSVLVILWLLWML